MTLGRSSLFVYWIHIEMVYGVIAEPIKQDAAAVGVASSRRLLFCVAFYRIVLLQEPAAGAIRAAGAVEDLCASAALGLVRLVGQVGRVGITRVLSAYNPCNPYRPYPPYQPHPP